MSNSNQLQRRTFSFSNDGIFNFGCTACDMFKFNTIYVCVLRTYKFLFLQLKFKKQNYKFEIIKTSIFFVACKNNKLPTRIIRWDMNLRSPFLWARPCYNWICGKRQEIEIWGIRTVEERLAPHLQNVWSEK